MSGKILLLLGIPNTGEEGVGIQKTSGRRDVKASQAVSQEEAATIDRALSYAKSKSLEVVALQLLASHLYHYGRTDTLLTGPAKAEFVAHIRAEVLGRGKERKRELLRQADLRGVLVTVLLVESDDLTATVLVEAEKGYESIFLCKEKKRVFPLLHKTIEQHLRKSGFDPVVVE